MPAWGWERQNRDARGRFRGFCPPNHQVHRYRLRVFAQDELFQHTYLPQNWWSFTADDVARILTTKGKNVGIASVIAKGARRKDCGGAIRNIPDTPMPGA